MSDVKVIQSTDAELQAVMERLCADAKFGRDDLVIIQIDPTAPPSWRDFFKLSSGQNITVLKKDDFKLILKHWWLKMMPETSHPQIDEEKSNVVFKRLDTPLSPGEFHYARTSRQGAMHSLDFGFLLWPPK